MLMKEEYQIRKALRRLEGIRGTGTELISLYIPPKFPISDVVAKLRDEYGQASNIKSKTTRLNVQGAIDKIMQYLKLYREAPRNGIAIFCGNISDIQAKPDLELFALEPPQPVKSNIYRCDSTFLLEPLEAMIAATDTYILVVMDGREATIATLKGTHVNVEKRMASLVHAKVRKGGQSQARYSRIIEGSIIDYYRRVADAVNEVFAKYGKVNGLIVGGPGPSKENFLKEKAVNYQIKVIGPFDTGYTDEEVGIRELLEKSKEALSEQATVKEKALMDRFMNEVARKGLATFGYRQVRKELDANNVSILLISEELDIHEVHYRCTACNAEFTDVEKGDKRKEKHDCGGNLSIVSEADPIDGVINTAERNGVEMVFVSEESPYGRELLEGFNGIAALLRHRG